MTTNKPMTGEQLDELMAVAVNFQRDSEKAGERSCANFAYAVQVAVLELRRTRDTTAALAAENASLKQFPEQIIGFIGKLGTSEMGSSTREAIESAAKRIKNPATDAFLAEVRATAITDALEKSSDYLDTDCVMDRLDISYEDAEMRSSGAIDLHDALVSVAKQLRKEAAQ